METSKDTNVRLAGTQAPLLDAAQLRPGVLLTGVAGSFVWQVLELDGAILYIQKLPATLLPCAKDAHQLSAFGRGRVCSVCQVRAQALSDFMPKVENKARVHVITMAGELRPALPHTVYGYLLPNGTARLVHMSGGIWNETLPIVPKLGVVWTIPAELRAMVNEETGPNQGTAPNPGF